MLPEKDKIEFNMWCLDAGLAFQGLIKKGVYNIIITSGTLTPFDSWEGELRMKFDFKLKN